MYLGYVRTCIRYVYSKNASRAWRKVPGYKKGTCLETIERNDRSNETRARREQTDRVDIFENFRVPWTNERIRACEPSSAQLHRDETTMQDLSSAIRFCHLYRRPRQCPAAAFPAMKWEISAGSTEDKYRLAFHWLANTGPFVTMKNVCHSYPRPAGPFSVAESLFPRAIARKLCKFLHSPIRDTREIFFWNLHGFLFSFAAPRVCGLFTREKGKRTIVGISGGARK